MKMARESVRAAERRMANIKSSPKTPEEVRVAPLEQLRSDPVLWELYLRGWQDSTERAQQAVGRSSSGPGNKSQTPNRPPQHRPSSLSNKSTRVRSGSSSNHTSNSHQSQRPRTGLIGPQPSKTNTAVATSSHTSATTQGAMRSQRWNQKRLHECDEKNLTRKKERSISQQNRPQPPTKPLSGPQPMEIDQSDSSTSSTESTARSPLTTGTARSPSTTGTGSAMSLDV